MKITRQITVECCDFKFSHEYEFRTLEKLMAHVKESHPEIYNDLVAKAEKMARREIGRGYGGDWKRAPATFRNAWIINALEATLRDKK